MKEISKSIIIKLGAQRTASTPRLNHNFFPAGCTPNKILIDLAADFIEGIMFTRGAKIRIGANTYYLDIIYGNTTNENNIHYRNQMYSGRIPNNTYTFGESPTGDQFCISCLTGEVYYWVHDATDGEIDTFLLAPCLDIFFKELSADEATDIGALAKSKKIKKIDLDF
ncbi:SMI1/KNR4 family protein [Pseudomonas abietaniphila]|uniref:SMI1/KNR4 family protein n=1 Tax=Pseudomonas abietaniphila TaxID=89065 RepID=UPI003216F794